MSCSSNVFWAAAPTGTGLASGVGGEVVVVVEESDVVVVVVDEVGA